MNYNDFIWQPHMLLCFAKRGHYERTESKLLSGRDKETTRKWYSGKRRKFSRHRLMVRGSSIENLADPNVPSARKIMKFIVPLNRFESREEFEQWIRDRFEEAEDGIYYLHGLKHKLIRKNGKRIRPFEKAFAKWEVENGRVRFFKATKSKDHEHLCLMYLLDGWGKAGLPRGKYGEFIINGIHTFDPDFKFESRRIRNAEEEREYSFTWT